MIELRNVSKTYACKKGSPPVRALDNVSLQFADTGMVFILGKSGSGKSTFLNVVGGLDRYDSGELIVKGKSSKDFTQSDFDSYRNTFIGFIFQEYNVLDEFTVGANIALAMELQGKKATKEALNGILEQVDLINYANRKPNTLSGGQKQRVAIARALIKNPEIIMADEPTGALDSNTGKQVLETLKKLSQTKLVIVVSHDREFAEQYGDRVIEFSDGRIISDITKYRSAPQAAGEGLHIIDDRIIHVKKGYTLTNKDLALINKYLAETQSDAIISTDSKSNADFCRVARIDDAGQKESFEDTSPDNLHVTPHDAKDFKLIRGRLPFKNSFKIGASSLKAKPVRLVFTILLCFIAFAMFGLADTMGAYDKMKNARYSIVDTEIPVAAFGKSVKVGEEYDWYDSALLGDGDLTALSDKTGKTYFPVYNGQSYAGTTVSFAANIINRSALYGQNDSRYYAGSLSGISPIDEEAARSMGGELLIGRFPTEKDEIAVSKYVYEHFALGGFQGIDTQTHAEVKIDAADMTPEALLEKQIVLSLNREDRFTVVGIVDTHMPERYNELKPSQTPTNGENMAQMVTSRMFDADFMGGLHGIGFVSRDGFAAILGDAQQFGADTAPFGCYLYMRMGEYGVSIDRIATLPQADEAALTLLRAQDTTGEDKFFASYAMFAQLTNSDAWRDARIDLQAEDMNFLYMDEYNPYRESTISVWQLVSAELWGGRAAWDYALDPTTEYDREKLLDAYKVYYEITEEDDWHIPQDEAELDKVLRNMYATLLQNVQVSSAYGQSQRKIPGALLDNPYGDKCGFDLYIDMQTKMFNRYFGSLPQAAFDWELQKRYGGDGAQMRRMEMAGVVMPSKAMLKKAADAALESENRTDLFALLDEGAYRLGACCVVGQSFYDSIVTGEVGKYARAMTAMPLDDPETLDRILNVHYTSGGDVEYTLSNSVNATLSMAESIIETLATVFLWVGVGFAVFAALMMFNFIATSISYKKREIGILRAVGAKSSDVFGIFFNESLLITVINFILAAVTTAVAVFFINALLRTEVGLVVTLLHFGIRQLALMLGVSVLVAFIASFLPVYRIAKKRPIDAIRGE